MINQEASIVVPIFQIYYMKYIFMIVSLLLTKHLNEIRFLMALNYICNGPSDY